VIPWSFSDMGNESPKIYFLPTLMTGGNLISGFAAVLSILHSTPLQRSISEKPLFGSAVGFVMVASVFDFLDGQLARVRDQESTFGREFDSLADLVSFGVAPALLMYRIVLKDFPRVGWVLATIYLLCCAFRLARFNCTAAAILKAERGKPFDGLPAPGAAGLIASLTWSMLSLTPDGHHVGNWKWLPPPLMLLLSFMMLSHVGYPSLTGLALCTRHLRLKFLAISLVLIAIGANHRWMPTVLFIGYLLYGMLFPCFSTKRRRKKEGVAIGPHEFQRRIK
jgi:CDP-diacylglycerol---serine O-phosphatidyltransferase